MHLAKMIMLVLKSSVNYIIPKTSITSSCFIYITMDGITSSNMSTVPVWCTPGIVMKSALLPKKLSICSINTQSICASRLAKLDELRQIMCLSNIDIVCCSESWLKASISDDVIIINGYSVVRNDRVG